MKCPYCGYDNPDSSHFCSGCGKNLDEMRAGQEMCIRDSSETAYLEEPYVPHRLVGVMAQNTPAAAKESHVWSVGNQKVEGSAEK